MEYLKTKINQLEDEKIVLYRQITELNEHINNMYTIITNLEQTILDSKIKAGGKDEKD